MKIKITVAVAILSLTALQSCKKEAQKETQANIDSLSIQAVVPDSLNSTGKDSLVNENASENKMFSSLKNENISLEKVAIPLKSVKEGSTDKAFLIFNEDQSKVEVFLPTEKNGIIYNRKGSEGNYTWTDGKNELINWKGYVLRTLKQAIPLFGGDSKS